MAQSKTAAKTDETFVLKIMRRFKAPREAVFRARTVPEAGRAGTRRPAAANRPRVMGFKLLRRKATASTPWGRGGERPFRCPRAPRRRPWDVLPSRRNHGPRAQYLPPGPGPP